MSDTPRTDALAKRFRESWNQFAYRSDEDFAKQCRNTDDAVTLARDLERENARLREALTLLLREVEESGNDAAQDFGWPKSVLDARAALKGE